MNVMFSIYTVLYILVLTFVLPVQFLRRERGSRWRWLRERLGLLKDKQHSRTVEGKSRPTVWIHAVSVGEALAARPLIETLREVSDITVSTVTDTGQKVVSDFLNERERLIYMPFDIQSAVMRTIRYLRPDIILVMETEIWPNLFRVANSLRIPLLIINGRISNKSFAGYKKLRFFMKPLLSMASHFCMQTERDAYRIKEIGAPEERIAVTGNLKFDVAIPKETPRWCSDLGKPVIVAGSTHEGEEDIILDSFKKIKRHFNGATMVIAPRHPQRFNDVEDLLKRLGFNYGRRSDSSYRNREVILLDTIGELSSVYGCADVCIIGGSFVPRGGQNLFEPAAHGKPVVCGPHMENFPLADTFFKEGAAVKTDSSELFTVLNDILTDNDLKEMLSVNAREQYLANRGAVFRTYSLIKDFIKI
jgi:3-deoxy-D-manno-octulosonic-acid transferase